MFESVRSLNKNNAPVTIGVHDEPGHLIATDARKAEVVKDSLDYLEKQLTRNEAPLKPFKGPPRPLEKRFTGVEICAAARNFKNGRPTGPDGIPNELLKYL